MTKILVVDDDELTRELLTETLERLYDELVATGELRILLAENGREAVDSALAEKPDLILMDVRMPVLGGIEAFYELKQAQSGTPMKTFFITGYANKGETGARIDQAIRDGALGCSSKPVLPESLDRIVRSSLTTLSASP